MSVHKFGAHAAGTVAAFLKCGGRVKATSMFQHDASPDVSIVPEPLHLVAAGLALESHSAYVVSHPLIVLNRVHSRS